MVASTPPSGSREKRKWFLLSLRHLRIARLLLENGFADACVFHAYHAYEGVLSALIAQRGYDVPPQGATKVVFKSGPPKKVFLSPTDSDYEFSTHKARILYFNKLADKNMTYWNTHDILQRIATVDARNNALYYDPQNDRLPFEQYDPNFATQLLEHVRRFAAEVWQEIG